MPLSSFFSVSTIVLSLIIILLVIGAFSYYRLFKRRHGVAQKPAKKQTKHQKGRRHSHDDMEPNCQLYVGNLPFRTNEDELADLLSHYGELDQVRIIRDRRSNRSKGFGFVTFHYQEDATDALALHQQDYEGRALIVRYAKPPA